jgi:hypothetical protein
MTKIRNVSALCIVALAAMSTDAFSPSANNQRQHSSLSGVEEVASAAMQHGNDMIQHGVVGPFSCILEGHHPAQFDGDGGIMMTEHLEEPRLQPGRGFVPPSPMRAAVTAAAAASVTGRKRPVPVYYMD